MWTSNPVADAERFYTETPQQAARAEAEQRIRDAFKAYFGGELGAQAPIVRYVPKTTFVIEDTEPVADSIADALAVDGECELAMQRLLTGAGTVQQLHAALIEQHIGRWADDLADLALQHEVDE